MRVDGFFEKRKIKIIKKMKIMRKWEKENGRKERKEKRRIVHVGVVCVAGSGWMKNGRRKKNGG